MSTIKTYPISNRYEWNRKHGLKFDDRSLVKAIKSGEFREPKKGEWFISGAIPEAYYAPNDLTQKYHIAKFVKIELTESTILI